MTTFWLSVLLASCVTSILVAYAAGARAGYFRGVAWGMHVAGREMMHVLAHGEHYQASLPPTDLSVLGHPMGGARRPD